MRCFPHFTQRQRLIVPVGARSISVIGAPQSGSGHARVSVTFLSLLQVYLYTSGIARRTLRARPRLHGSSDSRRASEHHAERRKDDRHGDEQHDIHDTRGGVLRHADHESQTVHDPTRSPSAVQMNSETGKCRLHEQQNVAP